MTIANGFCVSEPIPVESAAGSRQALLSFDVLRSCGQIAADGHFSKTTHLSLNAPAPVKLLPSSLCRHSWMLRPPARNLTWRYKRTIGDPAAVTKNSLERAAGNRLVR